MTIDSQIIWQSDLYECLFAADEKSDGWHVDIYFDEFPFESPLEAQTFLRESGLRGTIDFMENKFNFVLVVPENLLVEVAQRIAHRLVWRK